jgi:hypothetical protein
MPNSAGPPELRVSHTMPLGRQRERPVSSRGRSRRAGIGSTALRTTLSGLAPSGTGRQDRNTCASLGSPELLRHRSATRFISSRARMGRSRTLAPSAAAARI